MDRKIHELLDSLELSTEKRSWIEDYAQQHLEAEKQIQAEASLPPLEKKELEHFEVHPTIKNLWKNRQQSNY